MRRAGVGGDVCAGLAVQIEQACVRGLDPQIVVVQRLIDAARDVNEADPGAVLTTARVELQRVGSAVDLLVAAVAQHVEKLGGAIDPVADREVIACGRLATAADLAVEIEEVAQLVVAIPSARAA